MCDGVCGEVLCGIWEAGQLNTGKNFGCMCSLFVFFSQCIRRDFICAYFGHCEHTEYPVILGILTDFIGPIHWAACVGQLTAYEGPVQLRCGCGAFKCFQR